MRVWCVRAWWVLTLFWSQRTKKRVQFGLDKRVSESRLPRLLHPYPRVISVLFMRMTVHTSWMFDGPIKGWTLSGKCRKQNEWKKRIWETAGTQALVLIIIITGIFAARREPRVCHVSLPHIMNMIDTHHLSNASVAFPSPFTFHRREYNMYEQIYFGSFSFGGARLPVCAFDYVKCGACSQIVFFFIHTHRGAQRSTVQSKVNNKWNWNFLPVK